MFLQFFICSCFQEHFGDLFEYVEKVHDDDGIVLE